MHGTDQNRAALAGFAALQPTLTPDIRKVVPAGDVATVLNAWTHHLENLGRLPRLSLPPEARDRLLAAFRDRPAGWP